MNKTTDSERPPCPVTFALEVFGDRWTLLVLRDVLLKARYSYKALLTANPGIATNILADRLKRLERRMLVTKERDESDARQFLYKPTLLAISVIPMLVEMMVWGSENGNAKVDPEFKRRFKSDREALIAELQSAARESAGLHPR
jgi:DNA-binding HxlR family transcriptional regulator